MKKVLLLFLFIVSLSAKGQITFQKTYTRGNFDDASSVIQTADGGYVFTGVTQDTASQLVLLVKTDAYGDTLWTRTWDGDAGAHGHFVQQTFDGGYIITGNRNHLNTGVDIYLIKTDSIGDTLWTKTYGSGTAYDRQEGIVVRQTSDSGYAIAGATNYLGSGGPSDFILIKTDKNGNMLWSKCYGTYDSPHSYYNYDYPHGMQQTKDGGYIIAGERQLWSASQGALVIKTDSAGNPVWSNVYGNASDPADYHSARSIQQTKDGGYIVGDVRVSQSNLFKIDANGGVLWSRYSRGTRVIQTNDGGYALTGAGGMVKTDSIGDTLWVRAYSDNAGSFFEGTPIQQTKDGGFIIAGNKPDSLISYRHHCMLIKTDSIGISTCNVAPFPLFFTGPTPLQIISNTVIVTPAYPQLISFPAKVGNATVVVTPCSTPLDANEILNQNSITFSPNPFHTTAILTTNFQVPISNSQLKIFDVMGRMVKEQIINDQSAIINRENLEDGIYFYQLTDDGRQMASGKFVIN